MIGGKNANSARRIDQKVSAMMPVFFLVALSSPSVSLGETTPAPDQAETLKIDILVKQPEQPCEATTEDEIIVCAEKVDNERYRLRPIANAEKYEKDESQAEFSVGENATMAVETEQAGLGGGVPSPRLMVRLKIDF
jgi:hypothetical protein